MHLSIWLTNMLYQEEINHLPIGLDMNTHVLLQLLWLKYAANTTQFIIWNHILVVHIGQPYIMAESIRWCCSHERSSNKNVFIYLFILRRFQHIFINGYAGIGNISMRRETLVVHWQESISVRSRALTHLNIGQFCVQSAHQAGQLLVFPRVCSFPRLNALTCNTNKFVLTEDSVHVHLKYPVMSTTKTSVLWVAFLCGAHKYLNLVNTHSKWSCVKFGILLTVYFIFWNKKQANIKNLLTYFWLNITKICLKRIGEWRIKMSSYSY